MSFRGFYLTLFIFCYGIVRAAGRPNIVLFIADDLGWNDVGFHNKDIKSKNIDMLARNGVILDQSYVQPLCSPTRHSIMTGSYPYRDGLQHRVITNVQAVCSPLSYKILPQYMKDLGYATHIVGKWHLGFYRWECTPTYRGFDSFFGFLGSDIDFYNHTNRGYLDYRNNTEPVQDKEGVYSLETYTERTLDIISNHDESSPLFLYVPFQTIHFPIQVPEVYENMYPDIEIQGRRTVSGMVTAMDDMIGNITEKMRERGLYDNTLFIFLSDNGGAPRQYGNNFPLRGGKSTMYEGGTRGVGFLYGTGLEHPGRLYRGMIHAVDWLQTIISAAGGNGGDIQTRDGMDQWEAISKDLPGKRKEFVYNFEDEWIEPDGFDEAMKAIRVGDYKLILGFPGALDIWYRPDQEYSLEFPNTTYTFQLFDLKNDPLETTELSGTMPDKVEELSRRLAFLTQDAVVSNYPDIHPDSDPTLYNGVWTPFQS